MHVLCSYVCTYICMYVCMYVCTYVYMYACIYVCDKLYQPYKQTAIERKVSMVVKNLMNLSNLPLSNYHAIWYVCSYV